MSKVSTKKQLFKSVKFLIDEAKLHIVRSVNTTMLLTYFEIGRMIVEEEQKGSKRADYAKQIIQNLSEFLSYEFGRGYSTTNLEYARKFYLIYQKRIPQSVTGKSSIIQKTQSVTGKSDISKLAIAIARKFKLSWTHYTQLIKIENTTERNFYEIESFENSWSVREFQRQFESALFERLALSRDKKAIKQLGKKGQIVQKATDALKHHTILEFLDLKEDERYTESDIENAIINKLEHFMLEMGKGFLFEGRQKRCTFEGDSFYIDLVFYNRLLKCFVLFDLKIGKLTHQDIGQMQMYVNYYDRYIKSAEENPTIGIILSREQNKTVVEITLPKDNKQIFAKQYKLYLPSKEQLIKQISK